MVIYEGKYSKAYVMIDDIEETCASQIQQFLNHPVFINDSMIMPDTHAGSGSVIGFTMEINPNMIIPNTVGVDIGCGMLSINVGPNLFSEITKEELEKQIREKIPMGFDVHKRPVINIEREFPWKLTIEKWQAFLTSFYKKFHNIESPKIQITPISYEDFIKNCKQKQLDHIRAEKSIGTLGGGNHFLEIGRDEETGDYWITIHSGSRNYGKRVCEYWQNIAKEKLAEKREKEYLSRLNELKSTIKDRTKLPQEIQSLQTSLNLYGRLDKGLEYLEGQDVVDYLRDMNIAQQFASFNRKIIAKLILDYISNIEVKEEIESVHNYIDFRDFIIRKGAICSYENERMIIPFNMRDGILICEGKSNPDWNFSAPHGAGRVMSRSKAKEKINLEQYKKQMEGIYSTSVCKGTLDEAPDVYKDSKIIEQAIEPTAKIVSRIKPIINIKDKASRKRRR